MNITFDDTICAPATQPGTGAITVIRVSGPQTMDIVDAAVRLKHGSVAEAQANTVRYGDVIARDGSILDEVLVSVFRAPHSYTGEDSVEISCHASHFICSSILELLCDAGARLAGPGEFTRRAFAHGKMDLSQAEAVADVIASENEAAHRVAMNQLRGGFSTELQDLRAQLVDITSLLELELDFSEEDVEFADRKQLVTLVDKSLEHISRLTDSFRLGNAIKNGVPVAIAGATNTGKSTLLNALLGEERAIVSAIAGTTRDTIEETFNINGTLFRLIDTAGIRETDDEVESIGIDRTFEKLLLADVIMHVLDINAPEEELFSSARKMLDRVDLTHQKVVFVLNKADYLLSDLTIAKIEASEGQFSDDNVVNKIVTDLNNIVSSPDSQCSVVVISAKKSLGLETLKKLLYDTQASRITQSGTATLVSNMRHYNALCAASRSLNLVKDGISAHTPSDLVAQDLREALYHLGSITGDITTDEVLGNIFRRFCIGK